MAQFALETNYSTYLGGSSWEHARDVYTDQAGFTYVVGGSGSSNFTGSSTFPGANTYNAGKPNTAGDGAFGSCDVFITKLDRAGGVVWTKYMGGQNYDRAYALEVDKTGNIFISGRAGRGFPTTTGLQTTFQGTTGTAAYGNQNAFVAKLDPNGQTLWSTYLGTGELARDLAIDNNGSVYVPLTLATTSSRTLDANYFGGKLKNAPPSANTNDVGLAKLDAATGQLTWARFIGGSGNEATNPSVRVNSAGEAYMLFNTTSSATTGLPAVGAVSQTNRSGTQDSYIAKFAADGSGLVYGTYLGGSGSEAHETHSLALDQNGNAVVAINENSADFPVTSGALRQPSTGGNSIGITRFDANGARVASAVVGGSGSHNPDGIYVDRLGRIFITGETNSTDFPVTADALQKTNAGSNDGFILAVSADLAKIDYASYFGGTLYDNGRASYLDADGTLYVVGGTLSTNLPTKNAFDATFNGGSHPNAPGSGDAWAAKFTLIPTAQTLPGDSNFDGHVNFDDLVALAQHYNQTTAQTWMTGDFTRDGVVNFDDLVILAQQYNATLAAATLPGNFISDWSLAQSLVPEPSAIASLISLAFFSRRVRALPVAFS